MLTLALGLSATSLGQYVPGQVVSGGKIAGRVTYAGSPPALPSEQRDKNPEVCGNSHEDETLVVGAGGGIKNIVVYLADIKSGKAMAPMAATLDQTHCTYEPHVQAVPVGSTLTLLNSDPLLHNIHAVAGGTTAFNYAMPQSVRKIPKRLTKPGFLEIKCDVHAWMRGVVAVFDNPYFAVTGADGSFTLGDVPAGKYTLVEWHERLGETRQSVSVSPGGVTRADLSLPVK